MQTIKDALEWYYGGAATEHERRIAYRYIEMQFHVWVASRNQGECMSPKIVAARITGQQPPAKFTDPLPQVIVKFEGNPEEVFLFDYFPDEISFQSEEFIGLTKDDAFMLRAKKDRDYLRS